MPNTLILPYPISANRYWRNMQGRMVVSAEAKDYKRVVSLLAMEARTSPVDGDVSVAITLHPRTNKNGKESRICLDLDNCIKVLFDALQGVAFGNDRQVKRIFAEIGAARKGGGVSVDWGVR
jgi:crossover junction endodeoxyribonuclease RusA